jgi:arylsulfatase A-like enzyme
MRHPLILVSLCALVLGACGGEETPANTASSLPAYPALEAPPFLDLAAELPNAEVWVERTQISPSLIADRRFLTAGWSFPDQGDDNSGEEIHPVWTSSKTVEVEFYLGEVGPRTLSTSLGVFRAATKEDPLRIAVNLNGHATKSLELGPAGLKLELELPVEQQVVGVNRLLFALDKIWRISDEIPGSQDPRLVSMNCKELRFDSEDKEQARRRDEGLWMLPTGVAINPNGPAGERTLLQASSTLLRHWLKVPAGAQLTSGVALERKGEEAPPGGLMRVTLIDTSGTPMELFAEPVQLGEAIHDVSASLEAWAGEVVQLDFTVHAAGGSPEPVLGLWAAPRIEAPTAPTPEAAPAALAARTQLASAPVVLILLDAFNPAFAPSYGGRAGIAPELDRLASEGAQFDTTTCEATYTIASIPSILTGTYTWEHGTWMEETKLRSAIPTWAESFSAAGYRTVGFSCSTNGSSLFGDDRGFETFLDLYDLVREGRETVAAEQVLAPLDEVLAKGDERPLFLWLHIVEPHEPYIPPEPWAGRYTSSIDSEIVADAATLWDIRQRRILPDANDLAKLEASYEENISYVDSVMTQIRTRLEKAGIWDEAIVAVLSDHGEAFMDHDSINFAAFGHGSTSYDDQALTPLWIRLPPGLAPTGVKIRSLASNIDVLPTVADLTGVRAPSNTQHGVSLTPALFDATAVPRESAITHTANRMNSKRFLPSLAYRDARWKYIFTSGNRDELYDLLADPGEKNNVAELHPVLTGYYRQLLERHAGFDPVTGGISGDAETVELDEETIRRMQALGYVR